MCWCTTISEGAASVIIAILAGNLTIGNVVWTHVFSCQSVVQAQKWSWKKENEKSMYQACWVMQEKARWLSQPNIIKTHSNQLMLETQMESFHSNHLRQDPNDLWKEKGQESSQLWHWVYIFLLVDGATTSREAKWLTQTGQCTNLSWNFSQQRVDAEVQHN